MTITDDWEQVGDRVVRKSDGFVAMKHHTPNPAVVKIESDGTIYNFTTTSPDTFVHNNSLPMAIVNPIHVDQLLPVLAKICCGKMAHKFLLANFLDVSLWLTGGR